MKKERLMALQARYAAQAERNYRLYQETGITRYSTVRRNAEEIADAMLIAANASDDHNSLIHLRGNLSRIATEAARLPYVPEEHRETKMLEIFEELKSLARMEGLLADR